MTVTAPPEEAPRAAESRGAPWLLVLGVLLAAVAGGAWYLLRPPTPEEEIAAVERAWRGIRDAIVDGDDEAFFLMHSLRAREIAVEEFPLIRSRYLTSPEEERAAFRGLYRVTDAEFRTGPPRALVVKMAPWRSGWRERVEVYRLAKVKDVRFTTVTRPGGEEERQAQVILDITDALAPGALEEIRNRNRDPDDYMPSVVFVKDPEGWRRRTLFAAQ